MVESRDPLTRKETGFKSANQEPQGDDCCVVLNPSKAYCKGAPSEEKKRQP